MLKSVFANDHPTKPGNAAVQLRRSGIPVLVMLLVLLGNAGAAETVWLTSAGSSYSERFFAGDQIDVQNINELEKLWTHHSGAASTTDTVQASPVFTGEALISVSVDGNIISISPTDGRENWRQKLSVPLGRRGFTYFDSENRNISGIFVSSGDEVLQLDASDGTIKNSFDTGTSLLQTFVFEESLIVATLKEGVKSYDIVSGKKNWETSLSNSSVKIRLWSGFSFDAANEMIVVVTSNPGGIIGENRDGDDYSASVIAISADDGSILWDYKHISNDLWDYELVGNPIILKEVGISTDDVKHDCVIALSKTGDVILLDLYTGEPIFKKSIIDVPVPASDVEHVSAAPFQKKYFTPAPFESMAVNLEKDFDHLDKENSDYLKAKLRHAKAGFFLPPSTNYDLVIYGVHGGAEWPGGAVYRDDESVNLLVPSNKNPWILRIFHTDGDHVRLIEMLRRIRQPYVYVKRRARSFINNMKSPARADMSAQQDTDDASSRLTRWKVTIWNEGSLEWKANALFRWLPYAPNNETYNQNCSACHGAYRQGKYQSERFGGGFVPSLVGISKTDKFGSVDTVEKTRAIHQSFGIDLEISGEAYDVMMKYFAAYDDKLSETGRLGKKGFWQMLLDKRGLPASKPPWGKITNINILNGEKMWTAPLGVRRVENSNEAFAGDINFGGVLATKNKIVFATGTPDQKAYAYSIETGQVIWDAKLPYAGSAQPMAFRHRGCDIVVITATGGRFWGYGDNGDATVAYKLKGCQFD